MAYSDQDIGDIIETKGLETALLEGYLEADEIEDPELAQAVRDATTALRRVDRLLEPYCY
jgi:hypothetical protein